MAQWYYLVDGKQAGPVAPAELKSLAASGQLKPTDKVRRADMQQWVLAKQVQGLCSPNAQASVATKPVEAAPVHSGRKIESPKTGPSTAELFTRPWRSFENRWTKTAVFVACCAIVIPIAKWGGRFIAEQYLALTATGQTAPTSQVSDEQELLARGEMLVFDTTGHKNANGLNLRITYPRTWKAEEGERPVTVQRLISNGGQGNQGVLIQTWALPKPFDRELTEAETKAYLGKEVARDAIGGEVDIKSHALTQLAKEMCGMLEFEKVLPQDGLIIGMKALVFIVVRDGVQLMLTCYVQGDASRSVSAIRQEYDAAKPLFMDIVDSCVFID